MTKSQEWQAPKVVWQTWITRDDVRANPDLIYVYGDNVAGEGRRGLARHLRHEPNTHAIAISWGAFEPFTYETADLARDHIDRDLDALSARAPATLVWPLNGIFEEFVAVPEELRLYLYQEVRRRFNLTIPA
ncbi:MAG: hypothetical protein AAFP81_13790 [Pseudomonadota bacterium]